jgi:hypothetical protein
MPKENSHIFLAHKIGEDCQDQKLKQMINKNLSYFYFGSIFPDIFFYSPKEEITKISDNIHGKQGNLTNEIIFEILEDAKKHQEEKSLVFCLGILSHFAFDITAHPVIYYLSGNYYDQDLAKRNQAVYRHRHLETFFDSKINHHYYVGDLLEKNLANFLPGLEVILEKYNISRVDFLAAYQRFLFLNKLYCNNFVFIFYNFLHKIGLVGKNNLSLFYGNLKREKEVIEDNIKYQDLITGQELQITFGGLIKNSEKLAGKMIEAAYQYFQNKISKDECLKIIKGESLNTGKVGVLVKNIKYLSKN